MCCLLLQLQLISSKPNWFQPPEIRPLPADLLKLAPGLLQTGADGLEETLSSRECGKTNLLFAS